MRIYTGRGDRGKTSLFSGERTAKSDHRIEAFGDVDELPQLHTFILPAGHVSAAWAHLARTAVFVATGTGIAPFPYSATTSFIPPGLEIAKFGLILLVAMVILRPEDRVS